jgi:hypothetical protein
MPDVAADVGEWERHLCEPFTGRRVIVAFDVLAAMTPLVRQLARWGAQRPLLVADGEGTGQLPSEDDADILVLDTGSYDSLTEQIRDRLEPRRRLTDDIVARVEAYDPTGQAAWWVGPVSSNQPLLGRPVIGGRFPEQLALENKLLIDDLLRQVGGSPGPARIVQATYDELMRATAEVVAESGTDQVVWAGDASNGTNGGADYVRWVRDEEQARQAAEFFAARCKKVRVSAFLEGVPCSIHGIVLADGVVVLRPMELITLRNPDRGRFFYAGMGTTWDPPPADREDMRDLARRVGETLRRQVGYRGAFGIDGVLTGDGFRVTELNPRFSGGLTRFARLAPGLHLELVHLNALLDRPVGRAAASIEEQSLPVLDAHRWFSVLGVSTAIEQRENVEVQLTTAERSLEVATLNDTVVGTMTCGPSPIGAFVRLGISDGILSPGQRAAPLGVLALDFADRTWGTDFGSLLMAPDVREQAGTSRG